MPAFAEWNNQYHDDGFLIIFNNDADSLTDAENYLLTQVAAPGPFTATDHVQYCGNTSPDIWGPYGLGGYPTTVLLDRDGMIRQQYVGAVDQNYPPDMRHDDLTNAIAELTGGS